MISSCFRQKLMLIRISERYKGGPTGSKLGMMAVLTWCGVLGHRCELKWIRAYGSGVGGVCFGTWVGSMAAGTHY